jgi:ATP-binding protein involved in chromosome partitioning
MTEADHGEREFPDDPFVTADTNSLLDGLDDPRAGAPLSRVAELKPAAGGTGRDFRLVLRYPPGGDGWEAWLQGLAAVLARRLEVPSVGLETVFEPRRSLPAEEGTALANVAHLVAVSSAKGGVGKSTLTYNLALALSALGARVGVLDADIYGPSLARLAGLGETRATSRDGRRLNPLEAHGLKVMSVAFLVPDDTAVAWRGPMVTQALQQLLLQTDWPPLDYLLVDLPPGTGDIPLTLAQRIAVSGVVVVTTPQELAVLDARRGLRLFEKMHVPVLGVLENMRGYRCPHCGHEEELFGRGGGEALARSAGVPYLGSLPLDPALRTASDEGRAIVRDEPAGPLAARFRTLAVTLAARLAALDPEALRLPEIVTEKP